MHRFIARRPGVVLAVGAAVTLLALVPASRLRLDSDLASLLPEGSPAAAGYRLFLDRFGGFEKLFVMVLADGEGGAGGEGEETLIDAVELLAEELRRHPEVARARSGIAPEEEEFFRRHVLRRAPLLLGEGWREAVAERLEPAAIRRRVARIRGTVARPGGGFEAAFLVDDPLGLGEELPGLEAVSTALPIDPLSSTFLTPEGDAALVVVTPASSELDPEAGRRLLAALDAAYAAVRAEVDAPLRFEAVGGPLYAAHDEALLRRDLQWTVTGSLLGCTVLLLLAFRGLRVPVASLLSLAAALLATGGFLGAAVGKLSAPSVGFAAVLVGLGIDYGIHGGARYRERRLAGEPPPAALAATFRRAGPAILTSAVTTAVAFGTLSLAHFRPLRELGTAVAAGILAVLAATATVGAAVLVGGGSRSTDDDAGDGEDGRPGGLWRLLGAAAEVTVDGAVRRPGWTLGAAALLSLLAVGGVARLRIDADLGALRPVDHPVVAAEEILAERFGVGLDTATVVVRGDDRSQLLERTAEVTGTLRRSTPGVQVTSPADWLAPPERTASRLRQIAGMPLGRAADDLERELRAANLSPRAFAPGLEALRAMAAGRDPAPPEPESWPAGVAELVRTGGDRTSEDGAWAAVRVRLPGAAWPDGPPAELLAEIEAAAPGSAVASAVALGADMKRLASGDLERLGAAALGLVGLVVLFSFRGRVGSALLALLPVLLGSLWTLGLWGALGRPLDLLSLTVLPILLGIGIDDGLHALHGAAADPDGVAGSVRRAGRAMTLTTLTTAVGFGSLLLSHVPGLRHGGVLVALGVLACLVATLGVLPAVGELRRRQGGRGAGGGKRGWFVVDGLFWWRLHRLAVRAVPPPLIAPAVFACTVVAHGLLHRQRRVLAANLEPVLGAAGFLERQRRAFRTFHHFAWCLTERFETYGTRRRILPAFQGLEHWESVASSGRGFVLLTAHLGHWETGSMMPSGLQGRRIHVVREQEIDPAVQERLRKMIAEHGGERYEMHSAHRPDLGPKLLMALRRGEIVALQGDRPAAEGRAVTAPLFGRPFRLPAGPAALLRATGAPILPVFVYREARLRSRVVFHPPILPPRSRDRDVDLAEIHHRIATEIEKAVRRAPHQWFGFRRVWS